MVSLDLILQQLANGILFGGQIALIAVGLTLIWGVMDVLNFAHGSMLMIGGYIGLYTIQATESLILAAILATVGVFVLGVITDQVLIQRLKEREDAEITLILGTFGLAITLEHGVSVLLGSSQLAFPSLFEGVWEIGSITLGKTRVYLFVVALITILLLFTLIRFTKIGFAIRAVSQDANTAKLMGVNTDRIYSITFGLGAALAGLSGMLIAPVYNVYPAVGWQPFLLAFIVVIIGGLGSVRGTLLAALATGVFRSLSLTWFSSQATLIFMFGAMIFVLIFLPNGFAEVIE
ncbi:branched-chain amino acid ABC transporter permease [Natrinema halophilum]|uniref:Branched-chain amino acid ABC transporter permease n=1 Tax=Natrinema halophilum TaxID=1699371 RepID=A0A7D5KJV0_9EURY|nr:branched-chain amino acid ABC transporter permease [Natrinema halophilum]QLG48498.1 branched-chain amino acid ABC transporter permease [Natrinema halophilum]